MPARISWPDAVRREEFFGSDVRYELPPRQLGAAPHALGVVLLVGGLLFMTYTTVTSLLALRQAFLQGDGLAAVVSLIWLASALGGYFVYRIGRLIAHGHCELELTDGRISIVERAGWNRMRRRIDVAEIRSLEILVPRVSSLPSSFAGDAYCMLQAKMKDGTLRWLLIFYPAVLIEPLAYDLAERLGLPEPERHDVSGGRILSDAEQAEFGREAREEYAADDVERPARPALPQPTGSRIVVERFFGSDGLPGGATFNVPAQGLIRGSKGLFVFAAIWCLSCFGMVGMMLLTAPRPPIVAWLFVASFLAVGLAALVASIHMGVRRAGIAAIDGELSVLRTGLFGVRESRWEAAQIEAIKVGPSGVKVNNVPVMELQLIVAGKKHGMLGGLGNSELEWLADELRRALAI